MWMVFTSEQGVTIRTENYDEALKEYNEQKEHFEKCNENNMSLICDEHVILSRVLKHHYCEESQDKKSWVFLEEEFPLEQDKVAQCLTCTKVQDIGYSNANKPECFCSTVCEDSYMDYLKQPLGFKE